MPFSKETVLKKKFLKKANQVKPSHVCVWLIFYTVGLNINWSRIKRVTSLELANMWPFWTPAELKFGNMVPNHLRWLNTVLAVSEYRSFAKLWQDNGCSSQAETWHVKNILMKEFDWQVKFDVFVVSMATWTIKYNLKISPLLSLHKIRSLDFPINSHTAYYN